MSELDVSKLGFLLGLVHSLEEHEPSIRPLRRRSLVGREFEVELTDGDVVPVVVTSRCLAGRTAPVYGSVGGGERLRTYGAVFADDLPAHKARIKLQLALGAAETDEEIRQVFAD